MTIAIKHIIGILERNDVITVSLYEIPLVDCNANWLIIAQRVNLMLESESDPLSTIKL